MYFFFFCILDWIVTQWMKNWNRHDLTSWMDIIHIRLTVGWDGMRFGWIYVWSIYYKKGLRECKNNEALRILSRGNSGSGIQERNWMKDTIRFIQGFSISWIFTRKRWQIHYKDLKWLSIFFSFESLNKRKKKLFNRDIAVFLRWWTER